MNPSLHYWLKILVEESEVALALNVDRSTVAKRLQKMGMVEKASNWVPYELKEREIERRKTICEMFLQRQQIKDFFIEDLLETKNEFIVRIPKVKKLGEVGPSQPKQDIHCNKFMLCI